MISFYLFGIKQGKHFKILYLNSMMQSASDRFQEELQRHTRI